MDLKKRIVVWGAGGCGRRVFSLLKRYEGCLNIVFADSDRKKQGTYVNGIFIIEPEEVFKRIENNGVDIIIFAVQNQFLEEVTSLFRSYAQDVKGYVISPKVYWNDKFDSIEETLVEIDLSKPRLYQFQTPVTYHCNVKCKGCLNFCNLIDEPEYADFYSVIRDWEKIKELFWGCYRIKILGGEPLLNEELPQYVKEARRIFPDAEIMITTNGVLLAGKKDFKGLFDAMRDSKCYFDISVYELLFPKLEQIEKFLKSENVQYSLNMAKDNFYKMLSLKPLFDKDEAYQRCPGKECHNVDKGKIYTCSRPTYLHVLNEEYDIDIPDDGGTWSLHDIELDGWELKENLSKGFETCKYCGLPVQYKWEHANSKKAKLEDWIAYGCSGCK